MEDKNVLEKSHFEHPNLFSWNSELLTKIKDKEDDIKNIYNEMKKIEESNISKENELFSLDQAMKNTLSGVEKNISTYSKNISDKLDKFKNKKDIDIKCKSTNLFSLNKELYKDACLFFSKQEFKSEPSSLKIKLDYKLDDKLDDKLIFLYNYLFGKDDSNSWVDVLTPIWEIENQYKDMEINYQKLSNIYNTSLKIYNDKKNVYIKNTKEINIMKKELEALQEFSNKIKNLKEKISDIDMIGNIDVKSDIDIIGDIDVISYIIPNT